MTDGLKIDDDVRDFCANHCSSVGSVAIAVSGGGDSMALCYALSHIFDGRIYAYSVDHDLRDESAEEAGDVSQILSAWPNVTHKILTWQHDEKPTARVQEQARFARYNLIHAAMKKDGCTHLFLGHHMDDQAETFLFRLAKGSGLDGLACMKPMQYYGDVWHCRPLLTQGKDEILRYCRDHEISYIDDPSNKNETFARVRLRNSMDVLAVEGLTPKRLSVTASRMSRAREALDNISQKSYIACIIEYDSDRVVLNFNSLILNEDEVFIRVILIAMGELCDSGAYGARREKIENLCMDLMQEEPFRKRTLGGLVFERDDKKGILFLSKE